MDRVKALVDLGVIVNHDDHYEGEPGTPERRRVEDVDTVRSVVLPFTAEQWCSIAMREGDNYIGGCCGNTGVMQDIINSVFRDSGVIKNNELLELGEYARGHDGFDTFNELSDQQFTQCVDTWPQLDPWDKLGVIYNAVEPMLAPLSHETPSAVETERDIVHVLSHALHVLAWNNLMSEDDPSRSQTKHANNLEVQARIRPLLTDLLEGLESSDDVFEGYALVKPGTDTVMAGAQGLSLFGSLDDAKRVIELLGRVDNDRDAELRKVRVSVADGVVLGPVLSAAI